MSKPDISKILKKAESYSDYAAQTLSQLIKIPSISGDEEKIIKFLAQRFTELGADEVRLDGLGNVIARLGSGKPVIAIDSHVDTVNIGQKDLWGFYPFSGHIKDGKVWGRGASDQKAGMASMLTALKILKETSDSFPFTVYFVGSVLEEDCDGLCWQYLIKEEKLQPDIVIITEPTDGKINRGQRGRMELEIIVKGISCHGSAPERGDSAIYKMAPIITALQRLNDNLKNDSFLGKGTLAASQLRSESPSLCAVADLAAIYLDRRLTSGETPEIAISQLEELPEIKQAQASVVVPQYNYPSWTGLVFPTAKSYPTWELSESHPALVKAVDCYKALFAQNPVVDKWIFSTNGVATMGMFNIPTFGFGPGMEKLAHAPNEYAAIDDLVRCAAFYAAYPWIAAK